MQTLQGFRLSPQQKRLWLLHQDSEAYRASCAIQIEGNLNVEALKSALKQIVDRHESLRTTFQRQPGIKIPIQVIAESGTLSWNQVNLKELNLQEQSEHIEQLFQEKAGFSFKSKPEFILSSSLLTLTDNQHILLITLPALCADSWTLKNLVKEISRTYEAYFKGENLSDEEPVQYIQFSEWQNELLEDEDAETGKAYWRNQNFPSLALPFEAQPRSLARFESEVYTVKIYPDVAAKLNAIATLYSASFSEVLFACWYTLLWRLTGQSDIAISTVYSGRKYEELHEVLGLLAKWLPVRCSLQNNLKFSEVLSQVGEKLREVDQWQDYFIGEESTDSDNDAVNLPIAFEFDEWSDKYRAGDVSFSIYQQYVCFDRFKLKLSCVRREESIAAEFHYDTEIFDKEAIQCIAEQFQTLVESAANNPEAAISEVNILKRSTRHHLLVELNNTQTNYPQTQYIHHLFEQQVERTPNNIAVVFENQQLTYAELNAKANQLAHYLKRQGVGSEVLVGIYAERSLNSIIALLSILKAGGAYLPLDPALPQESLAFRLQDAKVPVLLTQQGLLKREDAATQSVVYLDADWEIIAQESDANPISELTPETLAYVLYTSGSTGQPKGVAIEHRQILNYLHAILEKLELPAGASFAMVSTFAADLGNTVIFPALCTGGCLHIVSQDRASDPEALTEYFQRHPIDCLKIVPSHLATLLASSASSSILPRQCLVLGGEAASWDLVEKVQQSAPNCRILNHYGPTEATVGVLTYPVKSKRDSYNATTVPIGRAIANTQVYLLDKQLQPVPIGVPGEVYIGGAGLARGYLNRPELTAEKFITVENLDGQDAHLTRVYKTGDKARYLPDGNIEFLGRVDYQVKIRGFRIELGEIEAVLSQHPEVLQTVVIDREDYPGNQRLVAYFVPKGKQASSTQKLCRFLKKKLPNYMMPSAFVMLKALPITPNGKVDRRALPAPDRARPELDKGCVAPRTSTEEVLAAIWAEVLGLKQVGVHDNFFELGGHSLQTIQLVSKISIAMNLDLSVKLLFSHPTIAELADALENRLQRQECPKQAPSKSINDSVQTASFENLPLQQASPFFQVERRSLLSLFATGKIAPVDAVALGYLNINTSYFEEKGLSHDDLIYNCLENLPVITGIIKTPWGRIADLMLPRFSFELYSDREDIVNLIVEALEIAGRIGARTVSLTGLIPSATDYGCAITKAIVGRQNLPMISTGHATTSSAVVLAVKRICSESGRNLAQERVGFIGLGSVGISSLRLMLKCLPHPEEITLCDVYSKLGFLEKIRQEITSDLGFRGGVHIVASQTEVPAEIYEATLIIGATNVPDVLDITRVKPGTLIVDDSAPHCFVSELAVERFQEQEDILFTEGGVLRSPHPISHLRYLPRYLEQIMSSAEIEDFLKTNPFNITGCVFSSLLSSCFENLKPTVGVLDWRTSVQHYEVLDRLQFQAADLHCGDYRLPEESIRNFRQRFGNS
ncbi:MAG: amino acid adenylation domain-containing protein [Cyanobacteriota bacterium]